MSNQRLISALTLVAFLPFAVGCSTTQTTSLHDDPAEAEQVLESETPVDIDAWINRTGEKHRWKGTVQFVVPDSLEFKRELVAVRAANAPPSHEPFAGPTIESLRLSRQDVHAVQSSRFSGSRTVMLVLGVLVVLVIVAAASISPDVDLSDASANGSGWGAGG